jgi:hypothetical protein
MSDNNHILGFDPKDLNKSLKVMRDLIHSLPSGDGRNDMQRRFDRVIRRIEQVQDRVLMQYDAKTIRSDAEFEAVYRMEMLLALDGWEDPKK